MDYMTIKVCQIACMLTKLSLLHKYVYRRTREGAKSDHKLKWEKLLTS